MVAGHQRRQPLGEPRAAGIDADERGVVRDRAAHALGERGERLLGVGQLRQRSARSSSHPCRISCAATSVAHSRAPRAVAPASASAVRQLASCSARRRSSTGNREAPASCRAKRRARAVIACGVPSACTGRPTTSSRRLPFVDQRARSRRSARLALRASIVVSGCATSRAMFADGDADAPGRRNRRRARSLLGAHGDAEVDLQRACPGSTRRLRRARHPRTGARSRCRAARIAAGRRCSGGSVEHHVGVGIDGEPRVLPELLLELAGGPSRVAERHQHVARAVAAAERLEHVLRRREAHSSEMASVECQLPSGRCSTNPRSICTGPP